MGRPKTDDLETKLNEDVKRLTEIVEEANCENEDLRENLRINKESLA
jgi:hypothetical protein